jgi:major membrane immunogen (membrane-anchored lipoprotein)
MISFKSFLEMLDESKHMYKSEDERKHLVGLDHDLISRKIDHEYYEDKIGRAIAGTNSSEHGDSHTKEVLSKFTSSPNTYIRSIVASHPEIHDHPDLVEKLKSDSSVKVRRAIEEPRKSKKVSKTAVAKPPLSKTSTTETPPQSSSDIHPEGKYAAEEGDTDESTDKVTHLIHLTQDGGKRRVGSVISYKNGEHKAFVGDHPKKMKQLETNSPARTHKEALLTLINKDRKYR